MCEVRRAASSSPAARAVAAGTLPASPPIPARRRRPPQDAAAPPRPAPSPRPVAGTKIGNMERHDGRHAPDPRITPTISVPGNGPTGRAASGECNDTAACQPRQRRSREAARRREPRGETDDTSCAISSATTSAAVPARKSDGCLTQQAPAPRQTSTRNGGADPLGAETVASAGGGRTPRRGHERRPGGRERAGAGRATGRQHPYIGAIRGPITSAAAAGRTGRRRRNTPSAPARRRDRGGAQGVPPRGPATTSQPKASRPQAVAGEHGRGRCARRTAARRPPRRPARRRPEPRRR
jgi:hypothetical protein